MDIQKTAEKAKELLQKKQEGIVRHFPETLAHEKSDGIKELLSIYKAQISQAVPKHVTPERIIQLCTTVISRNPIIKQCEFATVVGSVMYASILGLDVTPAFGQFFFIPRKNGKTGKLECVPLIGYKGYIQLMRRSGEVSTIYAHVVRENDIFEYELGLEPKLKHIPADANRGAMTHVYSVIRFKDSSYIFEVLTKADVMSIKSRSQAATSKYSPWNTPDEEQMWRKTAIRRLSNYAPLSAEFMHAAIADEIAIKPDMFDQKTKQVDPMMFEQEISYVEDPKKEPDKKLKKRSSKKSSLKTQKKESEPDKRNPETKQENRSSGPNTDESDDLPWENEEGRNEGDLDSLLGSEGEN